MHNKPFYPLLDVKTVHIMVRAALCVCAAILLFQINVPAKSSDSVADNPDIIYVFQRNDTLIGLAKKYFRNPRAYGRVMRYNRIRNERRIPVGFALKIPLDLLKYERSSGSVRAFRGTALIESGRGAVRAASVGLNVNEGDRLITRGNSSLSLRLANGSVITMPSNSVVRVARLRRILLTDSIDYELALDRGGMRSKVIPARNKADRYRTRTPVAVSAVRGTDYRNRYNPETNDSYAELVEGGLEVSAPKLADDSIEMTPTWGVAAKPSGLIVAELLEPPVVTDGTGIQKKSALRFVVEDNAKATGYRLQIARDAGFIDIVEDKESSDNILTVESLENGNYFAKFTAFADTGLEGLPATIAFKRRLNDVKASASATDDGYVFKWESVGEGNKLYHFQLFRMPVSTTADIKSPFGTALIDEAGLRKEALAISDLKPGRYYWRVGTQLFTEGELDQSWTEFENFLIEQ